MADNVLEEYIGDIQDIQWFDVEYRINFTSETGLLIFSRLRYGKLLFYE